MDVEKPFDSFENAKSIILSDWKAILLPHLSSCYHGKTRQLHMELSKKKTSQDPDVVAVDILVRNETTKNLVARVVEPNREKPASIYRPVVGFESSCVPKH